MLTRNGKTLFTQSASVSNAYENERLFLNTSASSVSTGSFGWGTGKNISRLMTGMTLVVGSGTTEPTVNDFRLESPVSSLSVVTSSNSGNRAISYDDNFIYTLSKTFRNNTENPITITELGAYSQELPNSGGVIMYAREVISPVTIQPGATYSFSITIG